MMRGGLCSWQGVLVEREDELMMSLSVWPGPGQLTGVRACG